MAEKLGPYTYTGPKENIEIAEQKHGGKLHPLEYEFEGIHKIELKGDDGETICGAELKYYSKPLPFYFVDSFYVEADHKGEGHASRLIDTVNDFLDERGKAGILVDAVMIGDPAEGFYERHGWKELPNSAGLMHYNLPDGFDTRKLLSLGQRSIPPYERETHKRKVKEWESTQVRNNGI